MENTRDALRQKCSNMAAASPWALIPSVAIVEILSYLRGRDRLNASSVCKRWRACLFHPNLWTRIEFDVSWSNRKRTRFLAETCGHFIREAVIKFRSPQVCEVRECLKILEILSRNKNLQCFTLRPYSCHVEWPIFPVRPHTIDRYFDSLEEVIRCSRRLRHFSLGCMEDLLSHSQSLVALLGTHQHSHLESLQLASIKEDSESYGIPNLPTDLFQPLVNLRHLSLDYDNLSNALLETFADARMAQLERLVLHVHGIEPDHEIVRDSSWRRLVAVCPKLKVTLNLIHSPDGVDDLLNILQPHMPLEHFRQFFCMRVNGAAMGYISTHIWNHLKTIHIIDGFTNNQPNIYFSQSEEDIFVMMAWRCHLLEHFSLIGYEIAEENVVAMARLRGPQLKVFAVPMSCVSSLQEDGEDIWVNQGCVHEDFFQKVADSLGRTWMPLMDNELPEAVHDDMADAERAYMDIVRADLSWKG